MSLFRFNNPVLGSEDKHGVQHDMEKDENLQSTHFENEKDNCK